MRLAYAKIIGLIIVLVGGIGGGLLLPAVVLYLRGGPSLLHEAIVRSGPPGEAGQRMLEITAFSFGAGLGIWIGLSAFMHIGISRGFFTKAEAMALLRGTRRR